MGSQVRSSAPPAAGERQSRLVACLNLELDQVERQLEDRGLPRQAWDAVLVRGAHNPYGARSDETIRLQPAGFWFRQFWIDMIPSHPLARDLDRYFDGVKTRADRVDTMALLAMGMALAWAARSDDPDDRFEAGRLVEACAAWLERRPLGRIDSLASKLDEEDQRDPHRQILRAITDDLRPQYQALEKKGLRPHAVLARIYPRFRKRCADEGVAPLNREAFRGRMRRP